MFVQTSNKILNTLRDRTPPSEMIRDPIGIMKLPIGDFDVVASPYVPDNMIGFMQPGTWDYKWFIIDKPENVQAVTLYDLRNQLPKPKIEERTMDTPEDLYNRFTYHPPTEKQKDQYGAIRSNARILSELVLEMVPEGRERSLALTKLEEAVFWANAGIARKPQ